MSGIGGFGNYNSMFDDENNYQSPKPTNDDFYQSIFEQHPVHKEHYIHKTIEITSESTSESTSETGHSLGHLSEEDSHKFSMDLTYHSSKILDHMTQEMKVLSPIKSAHHKSLYDSLHDSVKKVLSHPTKTNQEKDIEFSKMIFNTLGSANKAVTPKIINKIPEKLSNIMERMYDGPSEGIFDFEVVNKEIHAFFGGFGPHLTEIDPKINAHMMTKVAVGDYNAVRNTNHYKNVKSQYIKMIEYAEENGFKVNMHSHSFGSTISRLLADEFPSKVINEMNMLNAHMSPFNILKKLPEHIKLNYHTVMDDVLNLKQLLPFKEGNHTYYTGVKAKGGNPLANHTQEGFTSVERSSSNLMKAYARAGRVAGLAGIALTLVDGGLRIAEDSKAETSVSNKVMDTTADVGAVGGGFAAGGAAAAMILAPEVTFPAMLASFIVGGGVGVGVDSAITSLFHSRNGKDAVVTKGAKIVGNEIKNDANKVAKGVKSVGNTVKDDANIVARGYRKAGNEIKHDANKKAKYIRHFFGF